MITLLYFYPCLPNLSTHIIGPAEDNLAYFWYVWYGAKAVTDPKLLFFYSPLISYPDGVWLFLGSYYYWGVFLASTCLSGLKPVLMYNVLVLHTFVGAALAAYYVFKSRLHSRAAAILGAYCLTFAPFHILRAQHQVSLATIQFVILFIHFFLKASAGASRKHILLASLFMILSALCDWTYLIYNVVFVLLVCVYRSASGFAAARRSLIASFWVGLTSALALSPVLVPMAWICLTEKFVEAYGGFNQFVVDGAAFVTPPAGHWLAGTARFVSLRASFSGNEWEACGYLGWTAIVLVGATLITRRIPLRWFLAFAVFAVLAMGVSPHIAGREWALFPLPYRLLEISPLFSQARCPARILPYAHFFWALCIAGAAQALWAAAGTSKGFKTAVLLAAVLLAVDYYGPVRAMTPAELPEGYRLIMEDQGGDFGIWEIPHEYSRHQLYQVSHGLPIVRGVANRQWRQTFARRLSEGFGNWHSTRDQLIQNKIKYLVLYRDKWFWPPQTSAQRMAFEFTMAKVSRDLDGTFENIYADEHVNIYRVYR